MFYNNIADTDAALECVLMSQPGDCEARQPCGAGLGADLAEAYDKAFATDPTSAFGGIIALNQSLSGPLLDTILAKQFVEVVIAPTVDDAAVEVAKQKKNVRLLVCGAFDAAPRGRDFKRVGGGLLMQDADELCLDEQALKVVTQTQPDETQMRDLLFAWKVACLLNRMPSLMPEICRRLVLASVR